jgi:PAS domain S-box-containing protein
MPKRAKLTTKGTTSLSSKSRTKTRRATNATGRGEDAGLREREEQLRTFIAQAPVAMAMLDRQQRYLAASDRWLADFGLSGQHIIGRRHCDVMDKLPRRWKAIDRRWFELGGGDSFEEHIVHADGSEQWARREVRLWFTSAGAVGGMIIFSEDITARKRAEQAVRESEERYRLLADHAEDFVALNDTAGTRIYVSPSYFRRTGWSPDDLSSAAWKNRLHPDELPMIARARAANLAGETTTIEHRIRCRDGSWIWVENRCKPVLDKKGKVQRMVVWARDITERKRLESEVLRISEGERQRVAADLHDGVRQELLGIGLIVMDLRVDLEQAHDPLARKLREIESMLADTAAHTREVALGINPMVSHGRGLVSAMRGLVAVTARKHRVRISFACPNPVLIEDPVVANEVYRIAQEALLNAARHAKAKRIAVRFTGNTKEVCLAVRDDGCGLPANVATKPGMGLRLMKYRAGLIHGQLSIQPRRGRGTEVMLRVTRARKGRGKARP